MSALPPKADIAQRDRHVRLSWWLLMSGLGQKQTLADVRVMTFDVEQRQSESPKASTRPHSAYLARFVAEYDEIMGDHRVGKVDAEHAGDVIVAGAGAAHLIIGFRARLVTRWPLNCDMHDAFQHMGNVWTSQAVITVAALLHEDDKPRGGQLAKVAAGSWWRYAGGISKLCCG